MTTLPDRPRSALLVVDVQVEVVAGAHDRDGVVSRIAGLVDRARAEGVPVVWVQHHDENLIEGSEDWQIVPELRPAPGEPVVGKEYGDSFEGTELEAVLASGGIGRLVVTGAQTDQCIRGTIHGALTRGYDATLVADAHTTVDNTSGGAPPPEEVIAHTNFYWSWEEAPGRAAGTASAAEVSLDTPA